MGRCAFKTRSKRRKQGDGNAPGRRRWPYDPGDGLPGSRWLSSTGHFRSRLKARCSVNSSKTANCCCRRSNTVRCRSHAWSPLKWWPVLATSHRPLRRTDHEKWFAATKDVSPVKGVANIGFNRSVTGKPGAACPWSTRTAPPASLLLGLNRTTQHRKGDKRSRSTVTGRLKVSLVDPKGAPSRQSSMADPPQ